MPLQRVSPGANYFPAQNSVFSEGRPGAGNSTNDENARRLARRASNNLIVEDFGNSVFPFGENSTYMGEVVGDHAETDPPFHSGVALVETAPKTVPSLKDADATLTSGPPLLSLFEPALCLFALAIGAFRGATWNADPLDSPVMRRSFVLGRVERGIAGHQARDATESLFMRVQGGDHQV